MNMLTQPLKIRLGSGYYNLVDATGLAFFYVSSEDQESRRVAFRRNTKADALRVAQIAARSLKDHILLREHILAFCSAFVSAVYVKY